eukprot:Protomagalhaensia_wolfi_Nauph_80__2197@NODE_241_length_3070_cov_1977_148136_g181_i0_p1_GENE_NODE_241_length_3070_cov_1977_148136_g181_i0NODE_241_length_3070_cov_1977_148136_g181_i0_p1_ORF_typecomplete_len494_score61_07Pribosyltran_N/PF13793_6/7_6e32Pribosyltran_N/PF13793_6/0_22Pribosyl_synth/PF14572_6/2_6e03Pribosyl_synth/PF14572_6/1_2e30Pribosyltran/PF00156_27/8_8e02Pribosyltran/PF00156_27/8_5e09UPRTase/PF14681_6/0_11_NODE_241_length_3070_cov_1977_148136_g181_i014652946
MSLRVWAAGGRLSAGLGRSVGLTRAPIHTRVAASHSKGGSEDDTEKEGGSSFYTRIATVGAVTSIALLLAIEHQDKLKNIRLPEYLTKTAHKKQPLHKKQVDVDIDAFEEEFVENIQHGSRRSAELEPAKEDDPDQVYQTFGDECGMMIFAGSANPELAREVCAHLDMTIGRMKVTRFNDGEVSLDVLDDVRSRDVYIFQSVPNASTGQPLHACIMELFLAISALRRASAERITAVLPYMAYSRQDDVSPLRPQPLAVADMSNIIHTLGADRVIFVDLHEPRSAAFFPDSIPVTNLQPQSLAIKYLARKSLKSPVIVATENTAAESAKLFWSRIKKVHDDAGLATLVSNRPDRLRQSGGVRAPLTPEQFKSDSTTPAFPSGHSKTYFVGNVQDRDCVVVDDIIDTGVRVCNAVRACKAAGARRVFVYCTHGVLSKGSVERLDTCGAEEVIITNTIEIPPNVYAERIKVLNISKLMAEVLKRLHAETHHDEPVA